MREKLLINDVHLGVQRVAGTTQHSAIALRQYLLASLEELLFSNLDKDAIFNGDLFDSFWIAVLDALELHGLARRWLIASGKKMTVGRGNHDVSKDSSKLSSFDFVCRILAIEFPEQFIPVTAPQWLDRNIYMIPHMPNQDLFDLELAKAEKEISANEVRGPAILLLHANWNNHFAVESDHSLNVSEEQSKRLVDAGWRLIFGHEHQARNPAPGVYVTGNQWPSSVADCLNNPDNIKHAHILRPDVLTSSHEFDVTPWISRVETWRAEGDFAEVDWTELDGYDGGARFIRVTGDATAEQAGDVIETIARFRRGADGVFVVTNGVVVAGAADLGELKATAENIKSFDVMGYLLEQLEPAQAEKIRELIAKDENRIKEAA